MFFILVILKDLYGLKPGGGEHWPEVNAKSRMEKCLVWRQSVYVYIYINFIYFYFGSIYNRRPSVVFLILLNFMGK